MCIQNQYLQCVFEQCLLSMRVLINPCRVSKLAREWVLEDLVYSAVWLILRRRELLCDVGRKSSASQVEARAIILVFCHGSVCNTF